MTRLDWQVEDGAEPSLVNNSGQRRSTPLRATAFWTRAFRPARAPLAGVNDNLDVLQPGAMRLTRSFISPDRRYWYLPFRHVKSGTSQRRRVVYELV